MPGKKLIPRKNYVGFSTKLHGRFGANKRNFIGLLKEYASILTYYCAPTDRASCRSAYSVPYLA